MEKPFTINERPDLVVVRWDERIVVSPSFHEDELIEIIRQGKPVVFDFSGTRTLGSRWYRAVTRISKLATRRGHPLRVVFNKHLAEKAKFLGHQETLNIFPTLDAIQKQ